MITQNKLPRILIIVLIVKASHCETWNDLISCVPITKINKYIPKSGLNKSLSRGKQSISSGNKILIINSNTTITRKEFQRNRKILVGIRMYGADVTSVRLERAEKYHCLSLTHNLRILASHVNYLLALFRFSKFYWFTVSFRFAPQGGILYRDYFGFFSVSRSENRQSWKFATYQATLLLVTENVCVWKLFKKLFVWNLLIHVLFGIILTYFERNK